MTLIVDLTRAAKLVLGDDARRKLWPLRRLVSFGERVVFGGAPRERVLLSLAMRHYESRLRRAWELQDEPPHFSDFRYLMFRFAFHSAGLTPTTFSRAFYASELLRPGDRVLDIGCGDGFIARRFFATRCAHVDAVDIDEEAIGTCRRENAAHNVAYHQLDAVDRPFPSPPYDLIVWNGALGHFAAETTERMLRKIRQALAPGGAFFGSESLGREGSDHLQFFESTDDLRRLLASSFERVELHEERYEVGRVDRFERREAYWRCCDTGDRFNVWSK